MSATAPRAVTSAVPGAVIRTSDVSACADVVRIRVPSPAFVAVIGPGGGELQKSVTSGRSRITALAIG